MKHLSAEAKEAIVLKALNRGSESIASIATTNNVGASSLHKWRKRYREGLPFSTKTHSANQKNVLRRADKFQHILSAHGLDEVSLGAYCRQHGLYSHQLTEWKKQLMKDDSKMINQQQQADVKALKEDNKRLQRELNRKDKALAEASALLIMKKKADLIWGVGEAD